MIFLNNSDLMGSTWRFLEPIWTEPAVKWEFFYGVPQNQLERLVRRPNVARYRAALDTVKAARRAREPAMIVSHLPSMSAPTNLLRRRLCPAAPQIAFSFNFTVLPKGMRRRVLGNALKDIDEFVVYSSMERQLYAEYFDLDLDRLRFVPWAMDAPRPDPDCPVSTETDYVCAIGGEGRDYALFAAAMEKLPHLRAVVVARPYSVAGISFPANVEVHTNLPLGQTWAIAANSIGLAIPLKTNRTACGHVTMVGAQKLGVPLVVTDSAAVSDYVTDETSRMVPAGDKAELVSALAELVEDRSKVAQRRDHARLQAANQNCPEIWVEYLADACQRLLP